MKRFIPFFLFIIAYFNSYPQGEWTKLNSPTNLKIENIFCVDSINCWAAGDSGLIIHTSDGGQTWEVQNSGVSELIQDIFFMDKNIGWAVSTRFDSLYGSYILYTTNAGLIWEKTFFEIENKFFQTIYFLDSLNGFVAGGPSEAFYITSDGGISWNSTQQDSSIYSSLPVLKIVFYSKQYGIACGGRIDLMGVIWKTTDGGLNWSSQNQCCEPLRGIYFIDSLNILGVGGDYEYGTSISRTTDAGENWSYELLSFLGTATALSFRTKNEAWACAPGENKFIVSADSGKTWIGISTINNSTIYDLVFTDSLNGFAVGDSGVILKYSKYITNIDHNVYYPSTVTLFQNYPNPFNPVQNKLANVYRKLANIKSV